MKRRTMWLSSFALGATAAFLLDPISGKRRRHRVADRALHLLHKAKKTGAAFSNDLGNRARGLAATAWRLVVPEQVDDVVLEERVHSALGRVIKHPHAITVNVDNGHVVLDGPVAQNDARRLLSAVHAVGGVKQVDMRFDQHIQPAHQRSSDERDRRSRRTES